MIVATAGHIDHGKTRLVRALTGVDTDRLPQERARGISIDLGFAHADLGEGIRISFVDVPGHERFIRNMLAGVGAVDLALMVVAADDGPMPQTIEHLNILDLLDVRDGAWVISKIDRVSDGRVIEVQDELRRLGARSMLRDAPMFPVSSATGQGLDELRQWLCGRHPPVADPVRDERPFRMPIDRVFTVMGAGTVVTGTIHGGMVRVGDSLMISPAGHPVRVRGLRVQDESMDAAGIGQRCALNLAGVGVEQVARGDWVVHSQAHAPTCRLDVSLHLLASEEPPLENATMVQLHLGTASLPARVILKGHGRMAGAEEGFARLVTETPLCALHGDRFVIRSQSAHRTLGGGVVLDPFAPRRHRQPAVHQRQLSILQRSQPALVLAGLLESAEGGVSLPWFARLMNLGPRQLEQATKDARAVVLGREEAVALTQAQAQFICDRMVSMVHEFHRLQPRAEGIDAASLHRAVAPRLATGAFQELLRGLANRKTLVLSNDIVRRPDHDTTANADDERLWQRVEAELRRAGAASPLIAELAASLRLKAPALRDFLHRKSRSGLVIRIAPERFALRSTLACLAATAVDLMRHSPEGRISAAQFRDRIGTGRGLAIHYLEYFDRLGITQRVGESRRAAKSFVDLLGPADPLPPAPSAAPSRECSP